MLNPTAQAARCLQRETILVSASSRAFELRGRARAASVASGGIEPRPGAQEIVGHPSRRGGHSSGQPRPGTGGCVSTGNYTGSAGRVGPPVSGIRRSKRWRGNCRCPALPPGRAARLPPPFPARHRCPRAITAGVSGFSMPQRQRRSAARGGRRPLRAVNGSSLRVDRPRQRIPRTRHPQEAAHRRRRPNAHHFSHEDRAVLPASRAHCASGDRRCFRRTRERRILHGQAFVPRHRQRGALGKFVPAPSRKRGNALQSTRRRSAALRHLRSREVNRSAQPTPATGFGQADVLRLSCRRIGRRRLHGENSSRPARRGERECRGNDLHPAAVSALPSRRALAR